MLGKEGAVEVFALALEVCGGLDEQLCATVNWGPRVVRGSGVCNNDGYGGRVGR